MNDQTTNPKVSIIIISYNQEAFIGEAIEGAINQDYTNIEIIVSDDGSTDRTQNIITEYSKRYPEKIKPILNKKNSGITSNCNIALRACKGEFIALFGGDDIMLPGKISAQIDWFLHDKNRVLCATLSEDVFEDGNKCPNQPKYNPNAFGRGPLNFIHRRECISGTTLMIRSSAIPKHGFEESITTASDQMFCIEVLMNEGSYGCVNGVYTKRRLHGNNVSRNQEKIFKDQETCYSIIGRRYPKYKKHCDTAIAEQVNYYFGVSKLKLGQKAEARKFIIRSIKKRPFFIKSWIRLIQTYI